MEADAMDNAVVKKKENGATTTCTPAAKNGTATTTATSTQEKDDKGKDFAVDCNREPREDAEFDTNAVDLQTEDTACGIGSCRPEGLQCCARLICFTLTLSFAAFCSHAINTFFVSQITSIERQFELNSTQMGGLMSANDITFLAVVLLVAHFCKDSHSPRILGAGYIAFGLSCIAIAAMYFVSPRTLKYIDSIGTNTTRNNTKYLCIPGATERAFDEGCGKGEGGESKNNLPLVVFFGLMLGVQGISKATRSPLGTTYIDNNVHNKARTGFYIGVMFTFVLMGPAVGFAMGGVISRIPVDLSDVTLSSQDPRWIGAWWVGFLVIGIATVMSAIPLFCFPRRLPHRKQRSYSVGEVDTNMEKKKEDVAVPTAPGDCSVSKTRDGQKRKSVTESLHQDVQQGAGKMKSLLKDLPLSVFRLVKRPTLVIMLLALSIQMFAVVGYSSFLIKFVERQFGLPPWKSSSIFGLTNLVFGAIGTFSGGILVSRFNLTRRGSLRWVIFATFMSTICSAIIIFLGCDNEPIAGLHESEFTLDDGKSVCHCAASQFLPVCDGLQSFLSPCHAGCTRAANSSVYEGCTLTKSGHASVGLCAAGCYMLIPFIVVQTMSTCFGTSTITPVYVTVLRSAPEKDKTLAIGMVAFVMSLVGFIPAPIVFGHVIDTACVLWTTMCGRSGACALYDVSTLRQRYIGLEAGTKSLVVLVYVAALLTLMWQVRTGKEKDEKMGGKDKTITVTEVPAEKAESNSTADSAAGQAEKDEGFQMQVINK